MRELTKYLLAFILMLSIKGINAQRLESIKIGNIMLHEGDTILFGKPSLYKEKERLYLYKYVRSEEPNYNDYTSVTESEAFNKFGIIRKIKQNGTSTRMVINVWSKLGYLDTWPFKTDNLEQALVAKEIIPIKGTPAFLNWYFNGNEKQVELFQKELLKLQKQKQNTFERVYSLLMAVREGRI